MITYNAASQKSIANAVAKAKTVKPKVTAQSDFGKYSVCGSKGECYTVSFTKVSSEFAADCTCIAGKAGRVCYHIVAASAIYKKAVADRACARYTVRATDPDGFSYDSGYDNMATAQAEIDLLADSKAKYWQGFKFDLYDNLLPGYPPIWSRSVATPAQVELDTTCSNCGDENGFAFDGEIWLCGECLIAKEESRLENQSKPVCAVCKKNKKTTLFDSYSSNFSGLRLCKKCTDDEDERIAGWHRAESYGENL